MKLTYLLCIISVGVVLAFSAQSVYAADFSVSCGDSECSPASIGPFFNDSFLWYPSASQTRSIKISNTSSTPQYIGHQIETISTSPGANIATVLSLDVRRQSDLAVVWSGTVWDMYAGTEKKLDYLIPGDSETYRYTVTMQNVGNEYQGKSVQISLDFGYIVPTPTPIPTSTPTPTETPKPGKPTKKPTPTSVDTPIPTPTKKKGNPNTAQNTAINVDTPIPTPIETSNPTVLGVADSTASQRVQIQSAGIELGIPDAETESWVDTVISMSEELLLTWYEIIMNFLQGMVQTT